MEKEKVLDDIRDLKKICLSLSKQGFHVEAMCISTTARSIIKQVKTKRDK